MKLEVGMYVRTQEAFIRRLNEIVEFTKEDIRYWNKNQKIYDIKPNPLNMLN